MKHLKATFFVAMFAAPLFGCGNASNGSGDDTTSSGSGSGGTGGSEMTVTGSSGGSGGAATGSGGTASTSSTSTDIEPQPCEPTPNAGYPATLAWHPDAEFVGGIAPLQGESPDGAATGRFGPSEGIDEVTEWVGVLRVKAPSYALPDPVTFAVWTEPLCGLPTQEPPWQTAPLSEFAQELYEYGVKLSHPLAAAVDTSPQGFAESGFSAIKLTSYKVAPVAFEPMVGDGDPMRAMWLGLVDNDGDGAADAALGWATLADPSAPGVLPYPFDIGLGAQ